MKNNKSQPARRTYTFVALIIAAVACIATFFIAMVRGLASMQVVTVANIDNLNRYLLISAGVILLALALYAVLEPDRISRFISGRQARYGSNALIMIIAFIGILIVGNVLAYQNPVTLADLTEDKANTLAPELVAALEKLPEKITATGFFSQNMSTETADQLLSNIKANSNGKFDYEFINPDRDPQAARNAGVTGDGKVLLQMGERKEIAAFASEPEILKATLRLINPGSSAVYFLAGHGERDIEQGGETSMTRAKDTLESKNYAVKPLSLLVDNQIPEDASVIVIAGPVKQVSENEVKLLKDYLANGGSLIVMEDPSILTEFGDESDPLSDMLAKDWGIGFNNDIVIDLNSTQPTTAAAAYYDSTHPVTLSTNNLVTYFPFTRSLNMAESMEGITLSALVQTKENSWGETDFESLTQGGGPPSFDDTVEKQGPLTLVVAGENSTTTGRVVVFGGSNFAIDPNFDAYGNGDMFVNSVDWSAEQEDLDNITPKTPTQRTFVVPGPVQQILILLGSVFIIPGLVIFGGVATWLKRRRQG
ncbi:MAG: GldG family protein, partial [Anaerolineales bacterium]